MKTCCSRPALSLAVLLYLPLSAHAFDSGSTGADGALRPNVNLVVPLPPGGVLNYTDINIPAGVTVSFGRNATNTPVVLLVAGNAVINGTLNLSGATAADTGTAGNGNQGDDGLPGIGGPGGFDGGRGGPGGISSTPCASEAEADKFRGGAGLGPGGGGGGRPSRGGPCYSEGGAGGGFAQSSDESGIRKSPSSFLWPGTATAGPAYGSELLLPLIGGSGGGGAAGGLIYGGSGGGGGGGALLLAASGSITVGSAGKITANGGDGGKNEGPSDALGGGGGGGSGGAIRLVATAIAGTGVIEANGGAGVAPGGYSYRGTSGSPGRIRLEAESITYNRSTSPQFTKGAPGNLFIAGLPTLRIVSVGGQPAPEQPRGSADITLPAATPNPVRIVFQTTNVPLGNTVLLTVAPAFGPVSRVQSPALNGVTESATASVDVNLPPGPSVLQATTTYTVLASAGDAMSHLAGNERVERIELSATLGEPALATLVTVSGKCFAVSPAVLALAGG